MFLKKNGYEKMKEHPTNFLGQQLCRCNSIKATNFGPIKTQCPYVTLKEENRRAQKQDF